MTGNIKEILENEPNWSEDCVNASLSDNSKTFLEDVTVALPPMLSPHGVSMSRGYLRFGDQTDSQVKVRKASL